MPSAQGPSQPYIHPTPTMQSRLISEFLGTSILTFTIFSNLIQRTHPAFSSLSSASCLAVLIYVFGDVSGSHFNPCVSIALSLVQQQRWVTTLYYCGVQILGGIFAITIGLVCYGYKGADIRPMVNSNNSLNQNHSTLYLQAGFCEFFFTFLLCFVVLNTACCRANAGNQYFGLAIGMVLLSGGCAVGGITGGMFNPAVGIALDVSGGNLWWSIVYAGFQLFAAALAALFYRLIRPEDFNSERISNSFPFERLLSEFIGSFYLTLTIGCVTLCANDSSLSSPLAIGFVLMSLIYSLGSVSGSHFNPAITLAIFMAGRKKITGGEAMGYACSQIFGGVLGGIGYVMLMSSSTSGGSGEVISRRSFPLPIDYNGDSNINSESSNNNNFHWPGVFFSEVFFTFFLCFTVLSVATTARASGKDIFGLAIGLSLLVGVATGASLGGGIYNPAVGLGITISDLIFNNNKHNNSTAGMVSESGVSYQSTMSSTGSILSWFGYSFFEVIGALGASYVFKHTFVTEYTVRRK